MKTYTINEEKLEAAVQVMILTIMTSLVTQTKDSRLDPEQFTKKITDIFKFLASDEKK